MFNWLKPKYEPTKEDYIRIAQAELNRETVKRVLGFDPRGEQFTVIIAELCKKIESLEKEVRNK